MAKLNDTQLILLSTAARRDGASLYPLPNTLEGAADRAAKAVGALIKAGLAEERETTDKAAVHRTDGDIRYGMSATAAGLATIDAGPSDEEEPEGPEPTHLKRGSKSEAVIDLLKRDEGATPGELIEATGWLPHTTRAALTGLRKKGHTIERSKRGDETCYRITAAA